LKWVEKLFFRRPARLYDLVVLWDWEYDDDLVQALLAGAVRRRLSAAAFRSAELTAFVDLCRNPLYAFPYLIDRASDVHPFLLPVLSELQQAGSQIINDPQQMIWCRDKATMHLELVQRGIPVPYGLILSHQDHLEQALQQTRDKLGSPFVAKPAEGGGGEGVILDAQTPEHIRQVMRESRLGKVILQKRIEPAEIHGRRAWFRVLYVMGEVLPCFWDDRTHLYSLIDDLSAPWVAPLTDLVRRIAAISGMRFFSSEIAMTAAQEYYVIDFVNEMCDMRLQSRHTDGVPDALFHRIIDLLVCRPPQLQSEIRTSSPVRKGGIFKKGSVL